jgi:HEAT repeat protein
MDSLSHLLARLGGPGFRGDDDRAQAIAELRRLGSSALTNVLVPLLSHPDPEVRCTAAEAAAVAGVANVQELILPLLEDAEATVRWYTCGLLQDLGDERAVGPLLRRLTSDPDPQVRGAAADALGSIRSAAAVPALRETAARDYEVDQLGFTPGSAAKAALAAIEGAVAPSDDRRG